MSSSIKTKTYTLFNKYLTYFKNKKLKPTCTFTNELYIISIPHSVHRQTEQSSTNSLNISDLLLFKPLP